MRELVRGYAAAAFDAVEREESYTFERVESDLAAVAQLLIRSEELRVVLTDSANTALVRQAILEDLLTDKIDAQALKVLTFATASERAGELPSTVEHLVELAQGAEDAAASEGGRRYVPEPPVGRGGALERIRGYADYEFEHVAEPGRVDEIEDEIFRFARILESRRELRETLGDLELPLRLRLDVLYDLLEGNVEESTLLLIAFAMRAGRLRDLVGTLGFLVELAAEEQGRRVAHVVSAVALSEDENDRLAAALGRIARRPVELRVTIDESVIGGLEVAVGDTIIDGTVRHRLEQLKDSLLQRA